MRIQLHFDAQAQIQTHLAPFILILKIRDLIVIFRKEGADPTQKEELGAAPAKMVERIPRNHGSTPLRLIFRARSAFEIEAIDFPLKR